jgi:ABC-type microcin C transport system permease subunit YejE
MSPGLAAFLELAAVLGAGFLVTRRLLPWLVVRGGRLLGFRMQATPITRRRIDRFKRIKRGYYAFLLVCTLYVISLFLEFLINDKALVIHYDGRYAFPAATQWINKWNPFFRTGSYARSGDFGLVGDAEVPYRMFRRYCEEPEVLAARVAELRDELEAAEAALARRGGPREEPEPVPEPPVFPREAPEPPGDDATEAERQAYRTARAAWERARDDFDFEHLDEIEAYDRYRRLLRDWQASRREQAILETRAREVAVLERSHETFAAGKAWIVMPLCPYGPNDPLLNLPGKPPYGPSWWPHLASFLTGRPLPADPEKRAEQKILPAWSHPFGTTDNGLDVLPQLAYGFRISLTFALLVAAVGYAIGIIVGGIMGYYGAWTDIIVQRLIEIYGSIPFLYAIMIMASIVRPGLVLLVAMLVVLRSWLGITYYVRGEFYREKAKDYVQSAIGTGVSDWKVMITHILPNALVPVVTFAPFGVVSYMLILVSLDYLGLGLPPGTPSWGYLLSQGREYLTSYPHLILIPSVALAGTLFCVVVVGEAVREAFDPKVFSRLR